MLDSPSPGRPLSSVALRTLYLDHGFVSEPSIGTGPPILIVDHSPDSPVILHEHIYEPPQAAYGSVTIPDG